MMRFDPSAAVRPFVTPNTDQTASAASTGATKAAGDGFDTSTRPTVFQRAWNFMGRLWHQTKLVLSGFASLFGAERGSSMPTENTPAAAAQLGALRGRIVSKGAQLASHVQDAQAKYADAKQVATTSLAWAAHRDVPKPILDLAEKDIAALDARAETIFENIGNRHRSSTSRRNQRAKLDGLVEALHAIAGRIDAAGARAAS